MRFTRIPRPLRRAYVWAYRLFSRSLQVRVVALTVILTVAAVFLVGAYVSKQIARGLYEAKLSALTAQTAGYVSELESTTADSRSQLTDTFTRQLRGMIAGSPTPLRAISLESRGTTNPIQPVSALPYGKEPVRVHDLSAEFRDKVSEVETGTLVYQSISLPGPSHAPGLVVAQVVSIAGSGQFELFVVADLEEEQNTLDFVQRALLVAGLVLVVLVAAVAWLVTRLVVNPVRSAAESALRLADGDLDERMAVRGQDELAVLGRSFNDMADTLQEQITRMEQLTVLQRQFVSDVSHELRTPLTTIHIASEMLYESREDFDESDRRSAELLHSQVERFETLLNDLLEISRHDAGFARLDAKPQDLSEIVSNVIDGLSFVARQAECEIVLHAPSSPVMAEFDRVRVGRIVRNLVVNAIEHGEKQRIDISVASNAEACAVSVRDHGVGMTDEQVEHVFDRFWRADPSRKRTLGGSGLGLAISLEDAHLHGGWLQAWGCTGDGACFRLTLPRRLDQTITTSPLPLPPADAKVTGASLVAGPATSDGSVRVQTGSIPIIVEVPVRPEEPADDAAEEPGGEDS